MNNILFIDPNFTDPYDLETYNTRALRGTDATVVKVAQKLSEKNSIVVAQHNRITSTQCSNVTYIPLSKIDELQFHNIKSIIVLTNIRLSISIKEQFPHINVWVWLHDLPPFNFSLFLNKLATCGIGIITVSDFLKQQILDLKQIYPSVSPFPDVLRIYNPIDDSLAPDGSPYDPNLLAFISSPTKGLDYTLEVFKKIHEQHPQFELLVSSPYPGTKFNNFNLPGVTNLGNLQHEEAMLLLRKSLCLFYLNHAYPEVFGLVLAEANAVGTPVLTHPFGAAAEVLGDSEQLIDTYDVNAVMNRLLKWHHGERPKVKGNDAFRLSNIVKQWEDLLCN